MVKSHPSRGKKKHILLEKRAVGRVRALACLLVHFLSLYPLPSPVLESSLEVDLEAGMPGLSQ